jgi:hypothetical protein
MADPTLYEDLTSLLEGARQSRILRWAIRRTLESGREAQSERGKREAGSPPASPPTETGRHRENR